jgi:hypothetical protein
MAQDKYIVFKNADAHQFLSPEQKDQLIGILRTIAAGRRDSGKSIGDIFFVLNMKDQYAWAGLDAYIADIHREGLDYSNDGVKAALETAITVKQTAAMTVNPRLPDA